MWLLVYDSILHYRCRHHRDGAPDRYLLTALFQMIMPDQLFPHCTHVQHPYTVPQITHLCSESKNQKTNW